MNASLRLLSFIALPLSAVLSFAACNSPKDVVIGTDNQKVSCNTDSDCPSNEPCVAGFCDAGMGTTGSGMGGAPGTTGSGMNGCTADSDCSAAQSCLMGVCQPNTSAATGGGCMGMMPTPEVCDGIDNDCDGVVDNGASCGNGGMCANGMCVGNNGCASDADCAMGQQTCVAGVCTNITTCMTDAQCTATQSCINGICQSGSSTSTGGGGCMGMQPTPEVCDGIDNDCDGVVDNGASCGNGGTCTNGMCVAANACMTNADCAMGQQTCVNGVCQNIGACASDADCAMGQQTCVAGVCTNIMFCMSNADCSPMQTCVNNVCKP